MSEQINLYTQHEDKNRKIRSRIGIVYYNRMYCVEMYVDPEIHIIASIPNSFDIVGKSQYMINLDTRDTIKTRCSKQGQKCSSGSVIFKLLDNLPIITLSELLDIEESLGNSMRWDHTTYGEK